MPQLSLEYDGTLEDLKREVNKVRKMFGNYGEYRESIKQIEKDIYSDFDEYKKYGRILVGKIYLINNSVSGMRFYIHSTEEDLKPNNKPLYSWKYSVLLLWLMLILIILLIFSIVFCYVYEVDVWLYLGQDLTLC